MNSLSPLVIGIIQGLLFSWPVVALAIAYRLFRFPDISVEGSFLIGACVFASIAQAKGALWWAITGGTMSACFVGAITGVAHAKLGVNKFMAGILVTSGCYSVALRVLDASNVGLLSYKGLFDLLRPANSYFGATGIDFAGLIMLTALAIGAWAVLRQFLTSRNGLLLRVGAVGGLPAANLALSQPRNLVLGLAMTAALSGFGGCLVAMRQGFFDISMNQGILIISLASLSLGERMLIAPAEELAARVLIAAIAGSVVYQIIIAYAIRLGAHPADLKLITTLLVLFMLVIRTKTKAAELEDL